MKRTRASTVPEGPIANNFIRTFIRVFGVIHQATVGKSQRRNNRVSSGIRIHVSDATTATVTTTLIRSWCHPERRRPKKGPKSVDRGYTARKLTGAIVYFGGVGACGCCAI